MFYIIFQKYFYLLNLLYWLLKILKVNHFFCKKYYLQILFFFILYVHIESDIWLKTFKKIRYSEHLVSTWLGIESDWMINYSDKTDQIKSTSIIWIFDLCPPIVKII